MKNIDIKFVMSQMLLIAGLILLSVGIHWSFVVGFVLVVVSAFVSLQFTRPRSILGIIRILLGIGIMAFFLWLPIHGDTKPPRAALVAVWLGVSIAEFSFWRKNRRFT
jgi:hypothetical protein